ncbi:hypothetical protein Hanom_Chr13g01186101 [Helianthus anomalus]
MGIKNCNLKTINESKTTLTKEKERTTKQNKKKVQNVKFVKSRGTDKIESFENKSNSDVLKEVHILKRNSQNKYTQHINCCDVRPSTSRSRSSSSSYHSYDTSRFVERRS